MTTSRIRKIRLPAAFMFLHKKAPTECAGACGIGFDESQTNQFNDIIFDLERWLPPARANLREEDRRSVKRPYRRKVSERFFSR